MKRLISLSFMIFTMVFCYADSPLTSTDFYHAYMDIPLVQKAHNNPGKISKEAMDYLYDDNKPLDIKMAIINAIGWNFDRHYAYFDYMDYCKQKFPKNKYGFPSSHSVTQNDIFTYSSPQQKAVLIYLTAMADYFDTEFLSRILKNHLSSDELLNTQSFNISISLALAQILFDNGDWCEVYNVVNQMLVNAEIKDVRPEAIYIIMDYIKAYKEYCE